MGTPYTMLPMNDPYKATYDDSLLSDPVNSPDHYTSGGIETIAYLQAKLTPEEFRGYMKGNVLKYLSRSGKKSDEVEDLKKAQWYLNKLIDVLPK